MGNIFCIECEFDEYDVIDGADLEFRKIHKNRKTQIEEFKENQSFKDKTHSMAPSIG